MSRTQKWHQLEKKKKTTTVSLMIMSVAPSPQTPSMHLDPTVPGSGLDWSLRTVVSWGAEVTHGQEMELFTVRWRIHLELREPQGGWKDCWCPTGTFCLGAVGGQAGLTDPTPPPYANRGLTVTLDEKLWGDGITNCTWILIHLLLNEM